MGEDDKFPFGNIFRGFFGPGNDDFRDMTRHVDEMMKQMDEMLRNIGDIEFTVGYQPPGRVGGQPPGTANPRDYMLKEPDSPGDQTLDIPGDVNVPAPEPPISNRPSFFPFPSPFFGGPHGRVPPSSDQPGVHDVKPEIFDSPETGWSASGSSSSQTFSFNTGSGWTGTQIRTARHPDGTIERIEKKTENGRTCTTVTRTDPSGVTTSNTTCDRPAIGDTPCGTGECAGISDKPGTENPDSSKPKPTTYLNPEPGMTSEDTSFFNKLFGFNLFKPKKE